MFPHTKIKPPPTIKLIQGNTGAYSPALTYDGQPLESLGEGFFLMLIIKTPMGETVLSKTLTGSGEGTAISFDFLPTDTIQLAPFKYHYSIDLYVGDGQETYYTLERGIFDLMRPVGTFEDITT